MVPVQGNIEALLKGTPPLDFFGLTESPFETDPDAKYLFWSANHREALSSLFYALESGSGLLALIAPPGMGKTLIVRGLKQKLMDSSYTVVTTQGHCDARSLLKSLLAELSNDSAGDNSASMLAEIEHYLTLDSASGPRLALLMDDTQTLDVSVLETVRLLLNLEVADKGILQIVLAGRLQLMDRLAHPGLESLRQRLGTVVRLNPLSARETIEYIEHRVRTAGCTSKALFTAGSLSMISDCGEGIPRNINNLCNKALMLGYAQKQKRIDSAIMEALVSKLQIDPQYMETEFQGDPAKRSTAQAGLELESNLVLEHRLERARWEATERELRLQAQEYQKKRRELEQALRTASFRQAQMQDEHQAKQLQMEEAQQELERRCAGLEEALRYSEQSQTESAELHRSAIAGMEKNLRALDQRAKCLEAEDLSLREALQAAEALHEQHGLERSGWEARRQELERERKEISEKLEEAARALQAAVALEEQHHLERAEWEAVRLELRKQGGEARQKVDELARALQAAEALEEQHRLERASWEAARRQLEEEGRQARHRAEELARALHAGEALEEQHGLERASWEAARRQLEEEGRQARHRAEALAGSVQEFENRLAEAEEARQALQPQCAGLEEALGAAHAREAELIVAHQAEIAGIRQEFQVLDQRQRYFEEQRAALHEALLASAASLEQDGLRTEWEQLRHDLKRELQQTQEKALELARAAEAAEARQAQLQTELQSERAQRERMQQLLNRQAEALEEAAAAARKREAGLVEGHRAEIARMEQERRVLDQHHRFIEEQRDALQDALLSADVRRRQFKADPRYDIDRWPVESRDGAAEARDAASGLREPDDGTPQIAPLIASVPEREPVPAVVLQAEPPALPDSTPAVTEPPGDEGAWRESLGRLLIKEHPSPAAQIRAYDVGETAGPRPGAAASRKNRLTLWLPDSSLVLGRRILYALGIAVLAILIYSSAT